jgi:acetyltransferase-like isoleucine patch superfamily enzyme
MKKSRNLLKDLIYSMKNDNKSKREILKRLIELLGLKENRFHPLVFIHGKPKIGKNVYIGLFSEVNAKGAKVTIGDDCDIASFVSINVADSHKKCIGIKKSIKRKDIAVGRNVFIGSHSFIKGGAEIGHHSVIAAGTIVEETKIPPYSLVIGNPMKIKKNYYKELAKHRK